MVRDGEIARGRSSVGENARDRACDRARLDAHGRGRLCGADGGHRAHDHGRDRGCDRGRLGDVWDYAPSGDSLLLTCRYDKNNLEGN